MSWRRSHSLTHLALVCFFQIKVWTANPQQFVEDEDDDTFSYSVRISAQDLLLVGDAGCRMTAVRRWRLGDGMAAAWSSLICLLLHSLLDRPWQQSSRMRVRQLWPQLPRGTCRRQSRPRTAAMSTGEHAGTSCNYRWNVMPLAVRSVFLHLIWILGLGDMNDILTYCHI